MKKQVLFVILYGFADWEGAFLANALQDRIQDKESDYEVKTVAVSAAPVKSLGGFTVQPDYTVDNCPADYAALVLIGGTSWRKEEAKAVLPLLEHARQANKVVGAICDATVFLGMHGFLNDKNHTSNMLESLMEGAGTQYTGKEKYLVQQAVRDENLVTANGSAHLEFTREMLTALRAYPEDYIEGNYQFFRQGFIAIQKNMS